MKTTPEKLVSFLTKWFETGGIRKDEPLFVLMINRADLNTAAEWHEELSQFSSELPKLTDEDIEKVFDDMDGSDAEGELLSYIGDVAADHCIALREKSDRYKMYLELQKKFNTLKQ